MPPRSASSISRAIAASSPCASSGQDSIFCMTSFRTLAAIKSLYQIDRVRARLLMRAPFGILALALVELARFFRQHDGNAVADRIGQARGAADQLLTLGVVVERGLGQGANQDLQRFWMEAAIAAALGRVDHGCVSLSVIATKSRSRRPWPQAPSRRAR